MRKKERCSRVSQKREDRQQRREERRQDKNLEPNMPGLKTLKPENKSIQRLVSKNSDILFKWLRDYLTVISLSPDGVVPGNLKPALDRDCREITEFLSMAESIRSGEI